MMKSNLIAALTMAGHPPNELEAPGGSLLILPYGGRVLGLFSHSGENFFWVNPNLTNSATASAFFTAEGWKNSGGDRTWVAPEVEFFVKEIDEPWNTYEVPASLDPGHYTVQQDEGQVKLTNRARVVLHRQKKTCKREQHKIGVRAASTVGRMGYLRPIEGGGKTLVVRNFFVAPSGEYVDVPWGDANDLGYAIQCYNDDGVLGQFGEMEYHTLAIGEGTGLTSYQDQSQVWAFGGEEQSVNEVFKYLFGTDIGIGDPMSPFA